MQYLLRLSDSSSQKMIVLSLTEALVRQPAVDFVFDILGHENIPDLISADIIAAGQLDDFNEFQQAIFDRDAQGLFIRDGVSFSLNGRELNPDLQMISFFSPAEKEDHHYMRCDLVLNSKLNRTSSPQESKSETLHVSGHDEQVKEFSRILFLHEIAVGFAIDVTKDYPELQDAIKEAEAKGLIEVDVKKVAYKLSAEGQKLHQRYIDEAQDLIKRFDIFADVDCDISGVARFGTGLGVDLRVPAFEMSGIDPFRARFLLGINDGEWDNLSNWFELFENPIWYQEIFEAIETAVSIDEIGRDRMTRILEQGKALLREARY
ncbi:MAG: hypothetical protein K2X27_10410 [Candidatus Obscuribacterales bacterium]|nr:hypothetical protein [Candidatus Obscuribacterales bacterium]